MKALGIFLLTLVALSAPALASVNSSPSGGIRSGELGPGGCPVSTLEGVLDGARLDTNQIVFIANGENVLAKVNRDTRFRIPGYKRKELKNEPLAKLPRGAKAKLSFCANDGTLLSVRVLKSEDE